LNDWVEKLRDRLGDGESVPWFDPAFGGVEARSLFLLEAPGRKSMGAEAELGRTGSGSISVDNDDMTAQNCWTLRAEAGLPYRASVHWNVVPWYLGAADRIAAPGRTEIQRAASFLHEVVTMLPSLEVVVPWVVRPRPAGPLTRSGMRRRCTRSPPGTPALVCSPPGPPPVRRSWRSSTRPRGCSAPRDCCVTARRSHPGAQVTYADTRLLVATDRPPPGNRNDYKAWEESGAKAAVDDTTSVPLLTRKARTGGFSLTNASPDPADADSHAACTFSFLCERDGGTNARVGGSACYLRSEVLATAP
jgi:hypothetical protein